MPRSLTEIYKLSNQNKRRGTAARRPSDDLPPVAPDAEGGGESSSDGEDGVAVGEDDDVGEEEEEDGADGSKRYRPQGGDGTGHPGDDAAPGRADTEDFMRRIGWLRADAEMPTGGADTAVGGRGSQQASGALGQLLAAQHGAPPEPALPAAPQHHGAPPQGLQSMMPLPPAGGQDKKPARARQKKRGGNGEAFDYDAAAAAAPFVYGAAVGGGARAQGRGRGGGGGFPAAGGRGDPGKKRPPQAASGNRTMSFGGAQKGGGPRF